jgi:hypothetical protein
MAPFLFTCFVAMFVLVTRNREVFRIGNIQCCMPIALDWWEISPPACSSCFLVGTLHAYLHIYVRCLADPVFFF